MNDIPEPLFVFAYGSLIWRPDFQHAKVHQAVVHGYERRFWQASHDHRGTPELPGRVVTLVPICGGRCEGLIYQLPEDGRSDILSALDEREQDGYERTWLQATVKSSDLSVTALTWLAPQDNPSWAGDAAQSELVQLIATREGPSGSNREYLLRLHSGLEELGMEDSYIASLVREIERLPD